MRAELRHSTFLVRHSTFKAGRHWRAAAITSWVILFPENAGQMAAFGFVQHNFFILFNAVIGLLFWRRAQRDLLGQ